VRIVQLNLAFDAAIAEPSALLDRYHTLTGLSAALSAGGATVAVVQRFSKSDQIVRDDVRYTFVCDNGRAWPPPSWTTDPVIRAVSAEHPDVVHINGLMFPAIVRQVRAALPAVAIVLHDHSGVAPPRAIHRLRDRSWTGLREADAWSFTAAEHARPWRDAGLLGDARVFEILEASTSFAALPRERAAAVTGLAGSPVLLWVGRLNDNKDPLTVLRGFLLAMDRLPDARLWMLYSDVTLEPEVRTLVNRTRWLRDRVSLVGRVSYDRMPGYYSAADIFVSGSHREGSGYALIEAMSCGVIPVVTDIPSFRTIAAECGRRWRPGDARSFAEALGVVANSDAGAQRATVRERFARDLSWAAVGRRTIEAYRSLR
jgi:glycosyltransferase involved in cell wall biosynthesis